MGLPPTTVVDGGWADNGVGQSMATTEVDGGSDGRGQRGWARVRRKIPFFLINLLI